MRRLASVVLTGALLTACGDSFSPEGVSGLYNLVSVNGSAIPHSETVTVGPGMTVIETFSAGSVSLSANNTYSVSITIGIDGADFLTTDSGTFELVEPATIRFTSSSLVVPAGNRLLESFSGTLDGNRLTIIDDGDSYVFEK